MQDTRYFPAPVAQFTTSLHRVLYIVHPRAGNNCRDLHLQVKTQLNCVLTHTYLLKPIRDQVRMGTKGVYKVLQLMDGQTDRVKY